MSGADAQRWLALLPVNRRRPGQLPPVWKFAGYLLCVLVVLTGQHFAAFNPLDARLYDLQVGLLRFVHATPLPNDVEIIGIDEASLKAYPEPFALWHRPIAGLLSALASAQPAAVGLDVVLPDKSYEFIAPGLDRELAAGLLRAHASYPLVLAQTLEQDGAMRPLFAPYRSLVGPQAVGSAVVCNDPDGVVRDYDGSLCDGTPVATLASRMAEALGRSPAQVPGGWRGRIDFRAGPAFHYTPVQDVLRAARQGDSAFLARFRGRPVLIGAVLPLEDRVQLPAAMADWERGNRRVPGVLLHAQILRSMLNYGFLQALAPSLTLLLTALLCGAWFLAGPSRALIYWPTLAAFAALGVYALWLGVVLPAGALLVSINGAYGARAAADWLWERRHRRRVERQLAIRHSPEEVAGMLVAGVSDNSALLSRPACIMVCRIRPGALAMQAMKLPESGSVSLVNRMNRMLEDAMRRHHGRIELHQDDALRAVFDAPSLTRAVTHAVEAARDLSQALQRLSAALDQQGAGVAVAVHVGIDAGDIAEVEIGTARDHTPQSWGDAALGAARLADQAAARGVEVLVSQRAADAVPRLRAVGFADFQSGKSWEIEAS